ncbi:hypothetical protein [Streptacidiphilus sp. PAMC 29251]
MADSHHVLLMSFTGPDQCRSAFEEAKSLHGLRQAAIIERSAEGTLEVPVSHVRGAGVPTVFGAVAGGLLGMLGGPAVAAVGATAGAVLAGGAENRYFYQGGAALIVLGARVRDGESLLVAEVHEASAEPADKVAARFGGTLERLPADEFIAEVHAAEDKADQANQAKEDGSS